MHLLLVAHTRSTMTSVAEGEADSAALVAKGAKATRSTSLSPSFIQQSLSIFSGANVVSKLLLL